MAADRSPAANNEPVVGALTEVWSSVIEVGEAIGPTQWDLSTDCPGWTVRDQVSHLIGIERMLLGDDPPPPLAVVPEHVLNPFAEINESWIDARRQTPGPEVLSEFGEVTARRLDQLRVMPSSRFDEIGWSPVGEVPYREFMDTRVIDCWAHEQDIRRAVSRPGGRNGLGEAITLDRCESVMPYVVGKLVRPPDDTVVLFAVTGVMGRQIELRMVGGRAQVVEGTPDDDPTTALHMDQDSFWRLGFGRVEPSRVLATGEVRVDGDVALGHQILESMAFMI
jgi:uncharacterized protein (TIGR03083 family)